MFGQSKKGVATFNSLLEQLNSIRDVKQGNNWKAVLKDTLNLYIGTDSSLSKRLDELYFTRKEKNTVPGALGLRETHVYDDSKKEDFRNLIDNTIRFIKANGISRTHVKRNFLGGFSNAEIISGIVTAAVLMFGIGNYFGRLEKDREVTQYEDKLKVANQQTIDWMKKSKQLTSDLHC